MVVKGENKETMIIQIFKEDGEALNDWKIFKEAKAYVVKDLVEFGRQNNFEEFRKHNIKL